MTTKTFFKNASIHALALSALSVLGCGDTGTVNGNLQVSGAAHALQIGSIMQLGGTYEDGTCIDPATGMKRLGATWSSDVSSGIAAGPVVVLNDKGCMLDITSLAVKDSAGVLQQADVSDGVPSRALPLLGSFASQPTLFEVYDSGIGKWVQFYVNAMISPADFSSNFDIRLSYADSPDPVSAQNLSGGYNTVGGNSATKTSVQQPADSLDLSGVHYQRDASNLVLSISGSPVFTTGSPAGGSYVIATGSCPASLSTTDAAYRAATPVAISIPPSLADFGLSVGSDLTAPIESCMIVANCDSITNVCAYQLFQVSFN